MTQTLEQQLDALIAEGGVPLLAAASDLLEAGQALYDAIGNWRKPENGFLTNDMIAAGEKWVAAIAKATGA